MKKRYARTHETAVFEAVKNEYERSAHLSVI